MQQSVEQLHGLRLKAGVVSGYKHWYNYLFGHG